MLTANRHFQRRRRREAVNYVISFLLLYVIFASLSFEATFDLKMSLSKAGH